VVGGQPLTHQGVTVAEAGGAECRHEFKNFPQGDPIWTRVRRQPQDFAELPVRADQLQIGVEHGDPART